MPSYTSDEKVFVIKTVFLSACSYTDVDGKHGRDFYVPAVPSKDIEDTQDYPAVALLTPLQKRNISPCPKNSFILSGVRLSLLVLRPLLAYCTSPGW
jgi:hypothetical protein